jgi:hypothetical protein
MTAGELTKPLRLALEGKQEEANPAASYGLPVDALAGPFGEMVQPLNGNVVASEAARRLMDEEFEEASAAQEVLSGS